MSLANLGSALLDTDTIRTVTKEVSLLDSTRQLSYEEHLGLLKSADKGCRRFCSSFILVEVEGLCPPGPLWVTSTRYPYTDTSRNSIRENRVDGDPRSTTNWILSSPMVLLKIVPHAPGSQRFPLMLWLEIVVMSPSTRSKRMALRWWYCIPDPALAILSSFPSGAFVEHEGS